jgi:hypothetical protein
MPVSNALKRLLRIRDLEQEQHRITLESALDELRLLEEALVRASARERDGRSSFAASMQTRELTERHSARVETTIGSHQAHALEPRVARAEAEAAFRRQEYLLKRMERRQAETLIRATEAADAIEKARQSQQALDDRYLAQSGRSRRNAASPSAEIEEFSNSSSTD